MKLVYLLLALSLPAYAADVLFNLNGRQELETVPENTQLTPSAEIAWDSRRDGPLPADAPVGYAERYYEMVQPTDADGNPLMKPLLDEAGHPILDIFDKPIMSDEPVPKVPVPRLRVSKPLKVAYDKRLADEAAKKDAEAAAKASMAALKAKVKAKTATPADVREVVGYILQLMGEQ